MQIDVHGSVCVHVPEVWKTLIVLGGIDIVRFQRQFWHDGLSFGYRSFAMLIFDFEFLVLFRELIGDSQH